MSKTKQPRNWWAVVAKQRTSAGPMLNKKKEESRRACRDWRNEMDDENFCGECSYFEKEEDVEEHGIAYSTGTCKFNYNPTSSIVLACGSFTTEELKNEEEDDGNGLDISE